MYYVPCFIYIFYDIVPFIFLEENRCLKQWQDQEGNSTTSYEFYVRKSNLKKLLTKLIHHVYILFKYFLPIIQLSNHHII